MEARWAGRNLPCRVISPHSTSTSAVASSTAPALVSATAEPVRARTAPGGAGGSGSAYRTVLPLPFFRVGTCDSLCAELRSSESCGTNAERGPRVAGFEAELLARTSAVVEDVEGAMSAFVNSEGARSVESSGVSADGAVTKVWMVDAPMVGALPAGRSEPVPTDGIGLARLLSAMSRPGRRPTVKLLPTQRVGGLPLPVPAPRRLPRRTWPHSLSRQRRSISFCTDASVSSPHVPAASSPWCRW
jgi:hypothetical protein